MKTTTNIIIAFLLGTFVSGPLLANPLKVSTKELDAKVMAAQARLVSLQAKPSRAIPPVILKEAKGIIIMKKLKVGLGFGAEAGGGVALVRRPDGTWSPPAFVGASDASWGFQIGAKEEDLVILLMTEKSLRVLKEGKKGSVAVESEAAIGPVDSSISLDTAKIAPVLIYKDAAGAFVGVSLKAGGIIGARRKNMAYYGKTIQEILFSKDTPTSESGQDLIRTINKYSSN